MAQPVRVTALEVLVGNDVEVMVDVHDDMTPTPVMSHAILTANRQREHGQADGIESKANEILENDLRDAR